MLKEETWRADLPLLTCIEFLIPCCCTRHKLNRSDLLKDNTDVGVDVPYFVAMDFEVAIVLLGFEATGLVEDGPSHFNLFII